MILLLFLTSLCLLVFALLLWGLYAPGRAVGFWPVPSRVKVLLVYGLPLLLLLFVVSSKLAAVPGSGISSLMQTPVITPIANPSAPAQEISEADRRFAEKQRALAQERLEKEFAQKREAERRAALLREAALPENMSKTAKSLAKGVRFSAQVKSNQGQPLIQAETNFPEGTEFTISIMRGKETLAAERAYVEKGAFHVGPMLYRDEALYNGSYTLEIRSVLWSMQALGVRETIAKVKKLKGKYVSRTGRIEYSSKLTVRDSVNPLSPSEVRQTLEKYQTELNTFKNSPEFHGKGFAYPPAALWRENIRSLEKMCQRNAYPERARVALLQQIGTAYMHSKGTETPQIQSLTAQLKYGK